jgi:hypothetical protein
MLGIAVYLYVVSFAVVVPVLPSVLLEFTKGSYSHAFTYTGSLFGNHAYRQRS